MSRTHYQPLAEPFVPAVETLTLDKWWQPAAHPIKRAAQVAALIVAFVAPIAPPQTAAANFPFPDQPGQQLARRPSVGPTTVLPVVVPFDASRGPSVVLSGPQLPVRTHLPGTTHVWPVTVPFDASRGPSVVQGGPQPPVRPFAGTVHAWPVTVPFDPSRGPTSTPVDKSQPFRLLSRGELVAPFFIPAAPGFDAATFVHPASPLAQRARTAAAGLWTVCLEPSILVAFDPATLPRPIPPLPQTPQRAGLGFTVGPVSIPAAAAFDPSTGFPWPASLPPQARAWRVIPSGSTEPPRIFDARNFPWPQGLDRAPRVRTTEAARPASVLELRPILITLDQWTPTSPVRRPVWVYQAGAWVLIGPPPPPPASPTFIVLTTEEGLRSATPTESAADLAQARLSEASGHIAESTSAEAGIRPATHGGDRMVGG
jgi:hypothetical protein